jgi:hypothetical protein
MPRCLIYSLSGKRPALVIAKVSKIVPALVADVLSTLKPNGDRELELPQMPAPSEPAFRVGLGLCFISLRICVSSTNIVTSTSRG